MPKNLGDLGKLIVATGFKKLPNVQLNAQSGHTAYGMPATDQEENDSSREVFYRKVAKTKRRFSWPGSMTRCQIYFFILWLLSTTNNSPKAYKRCQSTCKIAPNTK